MSKSKLLAAIAALSILPLAGITQAAAGDYNITIDRSALSSAKGTAAMHKDLEKQATSVCRQAGYDLRDLRGMSKCKNAVVDDAVKKINDEYLTAYHEGRALPARYSAAQ